MYNMNVQNKGNESSSCKNHNTTDTYLVIKPIDSKSLSIHKNGGENTDTLTINDQKSKILSQHDTTRHDAMSTFQWIASMMTVHCIEYSHPSVSLNSETIVKVVYNMCCLGIARSTYELISK